MKEMKILKSETLLLLTVYFVLTFNISFAGGFRAENLINKEVRNGIVYYKNESKPYSGKFTAENIEEEYQLGIKNGFFKGEFTEDNIKYTYEGRYIEGIKHGEWIIRYPSGHKKAVVKYNYDKPYGKWSYFFEDNQIESYENFENGSLSGETVIFNSKGEVITRVNYRDGLLNGPVVFYYGGDTPELKTTFVNGKINGDIKIFSRRGKELLSGVYKNNKRENVWRFYYQKGEIKTIIPYLNGLKNGKVLIYDKGGTIIQTMSYKNGMLINPDGSIKEEDKNKVLKDNILERFKKFNRELNFRKYDQILSEI